MLEAKIGRDGLTDSERGALPTRAWWISRDLHQYTNYKPQLEDMRYLILQLARASARQEDKMANVEA